MTPEELKKYIGKYVSFTISENAFLPPPSDIQGKYVSEKMEGILKPNNGILSHFALDFYNEDTQQWEGIAIRDYLIPYIENFEIKES